jgi:hypothetical protein
MTIRALPVNSSAPPTTTRMRPSENTIPASSRTIPQGRMPTAPAVTVVAKTAPRAMKAPASTASTNVLTGSMAALRTPICSALAAISAGIRASSEAEVPRLLVMVHRRSGGLSGAAGGKLPPGPDRHASARAP